MKKLLALLLLVSNVVCAQNIDTTTGAVQTTTNIIDPAQWSNVIRLNSTQLSAVEGSGGGPIPAYNTDTNTIRFSFLPFTVSQVRAIDQVLSGQGISVVGFNYSWKIYNDLGNYAGTRGTLSVTGQLADKSGKVLESYFYDYSSVNTGAAFQTFSGTETFNNPYQLNSLGYVGLAWTGKDQNFWSGYYGPRVRETSLSLNYSVKQTTSTTTGSPTSTTSDGTPTAIEVATTASLPPPDATPPPITMEQIISGSNTIQNGPPPPPGSEPPPSTTGGTTTTNTTASTTQPPPTGSQPPPPGSQPLPTSTNTVANASTTPQQSGSISSGPSLSSILTTIKNNEKKEQAIAATAVQAANDAAQAAVQATEQTAMSVATTSSSNSSKQDTQQVNMTQQNSMQSSTLAQGVPLLSNTQQNFVAVNSQLSISNNNANAQQNVANNQSAQSTNTQASAISIQPVATQQSTTNTQVTMTGLRSAEIENTLFANNFLTNRSNPLTEIIENNVRSNGSTTEQKENPLNKTAQNNELSMGISLERMMVQPTGYNSYLQFALRDVAFYAPKEIYKNQVPADNKRGMYFLEKGNTDTYNKLIEGQYK